MLTTCKQQNGASLIAAVFLITVLAALGMLMGRIMIHASHETSSEWISTQALYAAESGIDWAAHQIVSGNYSDGCPYSSNTMSVTDTVQFDVVVTECEAELGGDKRSYRVVSTGRGSAGTGTIQRTIEVGFAWLLP